MIQDMKDNIIPYTLVQTGSNTSAAMLSNVGLNIGNTSKREAVSFQKQVHIGRYCRRTESPMEIIFGR